MNNIYQQKGYNSREHYLQCMAEEYNVSYDVVESIAGIMPGEEFDGLISMLKDAECIFNE